MSTNAELVQMFEPESPLPEPETAAPVEPAYYQAEMPGKAGSVRINLAVVERLAQEIRTTERAEGEQLGGILLGRILTYERCAVIEDYQTVVKGLRKERLYDSAEAAELQRALTIWRSDPDGTIRAIGLFRTDDQPSPAPGPLDAATVARHLPEGDSVLLLVGPEAEAALYLMEGGQLPKQGWSARFPWNRAALEGREGAAPEPAAARAEFGRARRWPVSVAVLAGLAAAVGAGLLWHGTSQPSVEVPRPPAMVKAKAEPAHAASENVLPPAETMSVKPETPAAPAEELAAVEMHRAAAPASAKASQMQGVQPVSSPTPAPAAAREIPSATPPPPMLARIVEPLDAITPVRAAAPYWGPTARGEVFVLPAPERTWAAGGLALGQFLPPEPIHKIVPGYPRTAAAAHVSGTVEVGATVGKDGQLRDVRALSGPGPLQDAAVGAVREWRYKPGSIEGNPVETKVVVAVMFRLGR